MGHSINRWLLQTDGHSVIPAVEETHQGYDRNNFNDLRVVEMLLQCVKFFGTHRVWIVRGATRNCQNRLLCRAQVRRRQFTQAGDFINGHAFMHSAVGHVRHTILAASAFTTLMVCVGFWSKYGQRLSNVYRRRRCTYADQCAKKFVSGQKGLSTEVRYPTWMVNMPKPLLSSFLSAPAVD